MENSSLSRSAQIWLMAGCLLLLACIGCTFVLGGTGALVYNSQRTAANLSSATPPSVRGLTDAGTATLPSSPEPTDAADLPTPLTIGGTPPVPTLQATVGPTPSLSLQPPANITQHPIEPSYYQYLETLLNIDYPVHDFYDAAQRLSSHDVGPRTVTSPLYRVGDRQTFFTDNGTTDAILMAVTDHTYFWVDEDLNLDQAAVVAAAHRFETEYYPRLIDLFGREWQPGVDNDPHFSVLHLSNMESPTDELGHFNSGDEYPRSFYSGSNQQELLYLNMDNLTLGSELYFGTLVHEYQHLVQWYVDANETAWLNEGLSQLAEIYVGLHTADTVDYLLAPDTQLTTWNYDSADVYAHYGASYLFAVYLWEQLGAGAIQELARHPGNGIASVAAILEGYRPELSLEQFIANWATANYLDDPATGSAYHYENLDLRPTVTETGIKFGPFETVRSVNQYGIHYIDVDMAGEVTVSFAGDTLAELVPVPARSGEVMWFAPAQENVNATLTRRFDLSGLQQATLSFWTWYDLKFDLDYAYVSISTDGGQSWELLSPSFGRPGEYGPAFNGRSADSQGAEKGGWVREQVSLNRYAGREVLIRFELLTYYESQARGFAVDDIAISELGYETDVENGPDGWEAAGFAAVGPYLPQQWAVQFIRQGTPSQVIRLPLDEFNRGKWQLDLGTDGGVLVIIPLTPFIHQPADYWLYVEQ